MRSIRMVGLLMSGLMTLSMLCAQQEARDVLAASLEYPGMASFWCTNNDGQAALAAIVTGDELSGQAPVYALSQEIPTQHDPSPDTAHQLVLRTFRLNETLTKAKVKFTYHSRVRASMQLRWAGDHWRVHRALIRQKRACEPGVGGSRFVWDF